MRRIRTRVPARILGFRTVRGCSTTAAAGAVTPPTRLQLRRHAMTLAVPMVGFGVMDNLVMIQAGEAIDSSIGVTLGLATMTSAAIGQIVSDVSGTLSGGAVEAMATSLGLPHAGLTRAQLGLRQVKVAGTLGAAVGVGCGCVLGMSCLFFMDLEKADRLKKKVNPNPSPSPNSEHEHEPEHEPELEYEPGPEPGPGPGPGPGPNQERQEEDGGVQEAQCNVRRSNATASSSVSLAPIASLAPALAGTDAAHLEHQVTMLPTCYLHVTMPGGAAHPLRHTHGGGAQVDRCGALHTLPARRAVRPEGIRPEGAVESPGGGGGGTCYLPIPPQTPSPPPIEYGLYDFIFKYP